MPASTSSSEDEDLSKFASCAVSADQIAQDAAVAARKRTQRTSTARPSAASDSAAPAAAGGGGTAAPQHHRSQRDEPLGDALDPVSVKIAAALDAILAQQLDGPSSNPPATRAAFVDPPTNAQRPGTQPSAAAAAGAATGAAQPAAAAAAAAGEPDEDDTASCGVRLFRCVPAGTPCTITTHSNSTNADTWSEGQRHHQRQQQGGTWDVPADYYKLRRRRRLQELIPRLNLAEKSRRSSKARHQQIMAALVVEGSQILAAATAAGSVSGSSGSSGSSWLKSWRKMKGQKVAGTVVEAKQFVPHDVRMAKLLGIAPAAL